MRGHRFINLLGSAGAVPAWVPNRSNPPDIAINWATNQAWKKSGGLTTPAALGVTTSRASNATNLLPTSPSGFAYSTFAANTTVRSALGRQTYQAATNLFLNPTAPVTQTITLPATGSYTIWGNWPAAGAAAVAAGTATITGAGSASQGTPLIINCTVAGTIVVTISGSPQAVQVEAGTFGTPFIVTAGAPAARLSDVTMLNATFGSAYTMLSVATPGSPAAFGTAQGALELFADSPDRTSMRRGASTGVPLASGIGGAGFSLNASGSPVWAQNAQGKMALAIAAGDQAFVYNGGSPATATATLAVTPTTIVFGSVNDGSSFFWNGLTTIDAVWLNQRVPNAQLQAMTQ